MGGVPRAQPLQVRACDATTVAVGGTAVVAVSGSSNGYYIYNPPDASEVLLVDPVTTAASGNGTTSALSAGQSFGSGTPTKSSVSVNAATSGHTFSCARW